MSRVFVTGGTGFIGGALVDALVSRGDAVAALARSDAAASASNASGAAIVRGDVLDEVALIEGMRGCDVAYHVAGVNTLCPTDPAQLFHVNVRGAEAAVRAAARAGVRRLVLTSSAAVLGEGEGTVGSERSTHRGSFLSVYEHSKHDGEKAALAAAEVEDVDLVCVNPASVQGPGRAGGTGRILIYFVNGRLKVFVDTVLSLVDIDDTVQAHLLAAERGVRGERYVLCAGSMTSREALAAVSKLTGVTDRPRLLPSAVAVGVGATIEAASRLRGRKPPLCREMVQVLLHGHRYDGSRAAAELGLRYRPVEETFRRTIAWAMQEGLITRELPAWRG